MLGSGNICAFKIQRTAIPVMSHIVELHSRMDCMC